VSNESSQIHSASLFNFLDVGAAVVQAADIRCLQI